MARHGFATYPWEFWCADFCFVHDPCCCRCVAVSLQLMAMRGGGMARAYRHYNDGDAYVEVLGETGKAGRYGAVLLDTETGVVTPVEDPTALLVRCGCSCGVFPVNFLYSLTVQKVQKVDWEHGSSLVGVLFILLFVCLFVTELGGGCEGDAGAGAGWRRRRRWRWRCQAVTMSLSLPYIYWYLLDNLSIRFYLSPLRAWQLSPAPPPPRGQATSHSTHPPAAAQSRPFTTPAHHAPRAWQKAPDPTRVWLRSSEAPCPLTFP